MQHIAQVRFYGTLTPCPCAGPPVTTLRQLLEHMLESIAADDEYQDFVRLVIGESGRFPALARLFIIHITKPGIERVQSYLADHPELGLPDPVATAHILVGTVVYVTLTQHILHGQDLIALPQKRLVNALMALLLAKATPASEMSPDLEEVITGADDTL
ncbi:TetR/AcrR family transcriptional regulator C-terminal domain-containing protein [Leptolyngbya sp. PCC 6406]|uniref:TetR/AcrR family transcriptional regulator C-terminal domain-containing protein n=1 Tax=Leptolyngbya sp. PCC 6406 TaxID=1173264 RepID=UPI001CEC3E21|nr:TetR/AcrR family transcriptional regulator C-terminal domain-containing protein [Leptolyngbya sp. PCC 6406]